MNVFISEPHRYARMAFLMSAILRKPEVSRHIREIRFRDIKLPNIAD